MLEIWTEKYRPHSLSEIVNQKNIVSRLQAWVAEGSIPNMLFAGPPGTGKTTIALALAKELFSKRWRENFLELNASDERGINVVRGSIKDFAKMRSLASSFKIIFLDESDALTTEAQQALRRTMERFSSTTRFILNANYSSRIIEPIQSRTAVFRFSRLKEEDVLVYLKRVIEGEKLKATDEGLSALYEISEGDLRKATNLLQAASAAGEVTREGVYDVASRAQPRHIREMLDLALKGDFSGARKKLYGLLISQGLSGEDVIKGIHREIYALDVPEKRKIAMIVKTGETEFRLNQGGSEEIQLEALLAGFLEE